jgi:hypothetical protein
MPPLPTPNRNRGQSNSDTFNGSQNRDVYQEIPTRKLISAYGGVGSVVETLHGSIIIDPFAEWPYFKQKNFEHVQNHQLEDERLLLRLRDWFPKLEKLIRMPINELDYRSQKPKKGTALVSAQYFPKWMFSSRTRRFDKLENWLDKWNLYVVDEQHRESINPPKCWESYLDVTKKKSRKFHELEQIRFILISSSGRIADVPWDYWVYGENTKNDKVKEILSEDGEPDDEMAGRITLNFDVEIPKNIYFEYKVSDRMNSLSGIQIIAVDEKTKKRIKGRSLKGLFNLRIRERREVNQKMGCNSWDSSGIWKVVLRSSNSVYYPNIITSLFIPMRENILFFSQEEIEFIKKKYDRGRCLKTISEDLLDEKNIKKTPEQIQILIENEFVQTSTNFPVDVQEMAYRLAEYRFITSQSSCFVQENGWLIIEPMEFNYPKIKAVYAIDRLKITSVQTSFTRQEPIDKEYYLSEDPEGESASGLTIKKQYTYGWRQKSVKYFPAVESFGEGFFIDFDSKELSMWFEQHSEKITERIEWIQHNFDNTKINPNQERKVSYQFVLIHTLCHLLIKELEFLCGYSSSSLQERLYIDDGMNGFLIYTIAGSEGSYGGLVSLAKSGRLKNIFDSAVIRATDCASDPICIHTDQTGQGVGGTNLAACYSCALLPETSCEEYNRFLDRRLIIDPDFGYYKMVNQI